MIMFRILNEATNLISFRFLHKATQICLRLMLTNNSNMLQLDNAKEYVG